MITTPLRPIAVAALLFIQGFQPASAGLSTLEKPWLGYFAVAEDRSCQLLLSTTGECKLMVLNKDGKPIETLPIVLQFLATETQPDGSVKELPIKADTVESTDPPTAKLKKTVVRYKLTEQAEGQPTLEVTLESVSGSLLVNARITDKGAFDKNPLVPVIKAQFAASYAAENGQKATWDKKQTKDFDRLIAKDSVTLKHLDGKQVKLGCIENLDPKAKEVNGSGSSSAVVDISCYQKHKIEFLAAPNSALTLAMPGAAAIHSGFWIQWSPDVAKDPDGKAKLAIKVK